MSTDDRVRPPVMQDVARLAGVSHQTVSRVLNAHPSVSPAARQRVEDAIAQLGYRPNSAARALVTRATNTLGVVTVDTAEYGPTRTLMAIEAAARAAGYRVHFVTVDRIDPDRMSEAFEYLTAAAVDGLIAIVPLEAAVRSLRGVRTRIPLVEVTPSNSSGEDDVAVDQVSGARAATTLLLGLGHRSVEHVAGPPEWLESGARIQGWQDALVEAGRPVPPHLTGDWSAVSGYRAGRQLTPRVASGEVSAVFVANDQMALGVMSAFHEAGLSIPDDVSIVGFDDIPEAAYFVPPLTTVRQDFAEVGRRCIDEMLCRISGRPPRSPLPLQTEIVRRSSAAAPPAVR
jgi:DNA-binding LacI/PurR family transcriptional regulator